MCDFIPARLVIAILAFIGFTNLYLIRFSFSVISVSMISRGNKSHSAFCEDDFNCTSLNNSSIVQSDDHITFDWNEKTRATVLGAFFYGYCLTQIIGGRLAEIYGTKIIFGTSVLGPALLYFLMPVASRFSYWATFAIRFTQGLLQGMSWPSMQVLLGHWFPVSERSRYMGTVFFASTLSMVYVMPLSGYLCDVFSWDIAFYIIGAIPIIWSFFWFTMIYNKPSRHPRIKESERSFIEESVFKTGTSKLKKRAVPWHDIMSSMPFIAIMVCDAANSYAMVMFTSQLSNFLSSSFDFTLAKTGFLAGLPFLCRYIGSTFFSTIADCLIMKKVLTIINTRRIFSVFAIFVPALMVVFIITTAMTNSSAFIGLVCVYMFFNGSVAASVLVNHLDIAPNYAGTLFGISNTFASLASAVSIWISGQILGDDPSLYRWRIIFTTLVPIMVFCEGLNLYFLSGTPQKWNFYQEEINVDEEAEEENNEENTL